MTAAPVLAKTVKFKLTISTGESAGQSAVFEKPIVTIGRSPENDVVLGNDSKVSRTHAEIRSHLGQLIVRNISQRNTVLVNGEKVEEKTISNGAATLQIGETVIQLQMETPADSPARAMVAKPSHEPDHTQIIRKSDAYSAPAPAPQASPAQNFSAAPPKAPRGPRPVMSSGGDSGRLRFYMIIAVVGAVLYWLLSDSGGEKKEEVQLRTEVDVARAIEESAQAVQEIKKEQQASGKDSIQYKAAQEHYIKGFRDYRLGQYARAMQSFQAALSFYPSHELARRYWTQSQRKFEEQIDFHMEQGRKFKQKQNYRLCQSSFAQVMVMLKDSSKPKYKEAKNNYDECLLRDEGRF